MIVRFRNRRRLGPAVGWTTSTAGLAMPVDGRGGPTRLGCTDEGLYAIDYDPEDFARELDDIQAGGR